MNPDFWQGRKVFLTGHTGFKGSWLSLWLQRLGAEVHGFALEPFTNPSLFKVANVTDGMKSTIGDVQDLASLQKAMERRRDRILADLDTNKDGAISRAELDASVDRLIAAADADRDGGVTLDEAKSYRLAKLRKPATPTGEQAN